MTPAMFFPGKYHGFLYQSWKYLLVSAAYSDLCYTSAYKSRLWIVKDNNEK